MNDIREAIQQEEKKLYLIRQFEDKIALTAVIKDKVSQVVHDYFLGDTKTFDIFEFLKKGGTNNGR